MLRSHFPSLLGCVVATACLSSLAPARQLLAQNPTAQQRSGQQLSAQRIGDQPATTKKRLASKYLQTDGKSELEVTYKTVGDKALKLDLYYPNPKPDQPIPVVVFTHGGGWAAGSRYKAASGLFARVFTRLLDKGFAVAPVTYRLAKKDSNVAMRDCVIDCKDAIRYLAKHSDTLGINPQQVFVMGDSAGGHLAQMLLLTSPEQLTGDPDLKDVSYRMVAGVSWYGPADFETTDLFNHDDRANFRDRFGPRIMQSNTGSSDKLARYREVSPVNYLTKDSAPLLMIQGDKDTTIPVKHAYFMQKKAEPIGAPVEVMIIRNSGHNWRAVDGKVTPTTDEIVNRTVDFLSTNKP